ncbi:MAG: hypothetical protein A3K19_29465 [Lentisphaerae bacterium RIFOXYB12_FULL_65_16]|nr:MAG: hypothetical protein A3K18_33240 [Lentisphaerae bacterium RIFOXYA12_64_32]OGV88285.1 MAG: hypothetical protein A3K19_29465 [Lentisphaerae bacterium RIFOXYB12_FULL_65_16]
MTTRDKTHLRDLACKYAEYACGAPMAQRREKWRLHNRLQERTVPFHIEDNGSYLRDLTPPLECEDGECRALEARLLYALVSYEKINDDRIIPDRFLVDWSTPMTALCDELRITRADDGHGGKLGYETNKPVKDIDADFGKLKHRTIRLDKEGTERRLQLAKDVFAGLLPVELGRPSSLYSNGITNAAVHLMGMQELYLEMAMNPDAVHRLFTFLAEDNLALGRWEGDQGLLTLNHDGNQGYCSGSSQYSDETAVAAGAKVASTDRYGYLESQESAGISPGMFDEFLMPHFTRFADRFKLMKFGCCEPVHALMPHLQRLHGLRKVSVTPWCDLNALAGNCRDDVIWCRKPVPLKLCGGTFDSGELRAHLQETLDIGQDYFVEFVFRDTNLLTGDMVDRVAQACRIVRELSGHSEGSRE